ncbi:MAG TPA: anti-sigma factor [Candidatus Micrarchaeia archaeon]|nr:anti-sigma factor [Candidatus Micrarchaeia archaeon]
MGGPPGTAGGPGSGCDSVRDLLGAHVLDGLEPDEAAAVTEHLQGCADCAAEERAFRGVAACLAMSVPPVAPPPALRARVLAAARVEGGAAAPAPPVPAALPLVPPPAAGPVPDRAPGARWWARSQAGWTAAAAAAVLALSGLGWGVAEHLQRPPAAPGAGGPGVVGITGLLSGGATVVALQATGRAPGGAALVMRPRAGAAYLVVTGVRPVRGSTVYMLWYVRHRAGGSRPVPIAAVTRAGVFRMPRAPRGFAAVAITLEPSRHDRVPLGPVLLRASLA